MARKINKAAEQEFLNALAVGATVESAARRAGIGERTAYRRLADPAFQARLKQAQSDAVLRISAMLIGGSPSSIKRLFDLQHEPAAPAGVQRAAARDVLELGLKYRLAGELEQRVTAVEQRLDDSNQSNARLAQAPE